MRRLIAAALLLVAGSGWAPPAHAQAPDTLRVGLVSEPDILDPVPGNTFVGRVVFAALCDRLVDYNENLELIPQLATEWSWSADGLALTIKLRPNVVFHDGEPFNAEAVKFNLERAQTMQGSMRRSEVAGIERIEVVDDLTVRLHVPTRFAPLMTLFSDRAGMMVSPRAARAAGANFGQNPVCAGPYRFVERVAQDRIVVERFDRYWDRDNIHIQRIVYRPIPDATVRLANLQSGSIDFMDRVQPTDLEAIRRDSRLRLVGITEIGWNSIEFNVANGERANTPLGRDPRVREAVALAIDRDILNQAAFAGEFVPQTQWFPPSSPYYVGDWPQPVRNLERARALLREAGVPNLSFQLLIPNDTERVQVAQILQAMLREAGIDMRIQMAEFATSLVQARRGDFDAYIIGWSGRPDPDGNIHSFFHCQGPQNDPQLCDPEIDAALQRARETTDVPERQRLYTAIQRRMAESRARLVLYNRKWFFAHTTRLTGFRVNPDGLIRVQGLRYQ
jgi:peptide/nickel transport system substrate-binding protein